MSAGAEITVRCARDDDLPKIVDFNARLADETEALELDRTVLERGVRKLLGDRSRGEYFIAEIDGRIAGQLMITREWSDWRDGDIWWVQSVYVAPEFRRRGAFRALYKFVRDRAKDAQAVGLRLYVEQDNDSAQRTYESLGMRRARYRLMQEMFRGDADHE
ncbi:MAG: GNAT family N-acetyltransferase [Tepidisphaeraceae bacterium]